MGKAGKAKKKQKLMAQATATVTAPAAQEDFSSDDESSDDKDDLLTAVCVLNTLSTRLPLYDGRPMKALRMALFPLITQQLDKFFEDPPPAPPLSEDSLSEILSPTNVSTTLRLAHTLTQLTQEMFASLDYKEFRRALHPFVLYHRRKTSMSDVPAKPTSSSRIYPPGWTAHATKEDCERTSASVALPAATATAIAADKKKQSLSNRVAYFYRIGDWQGALRALYELRVSNDMPKLGSLQRWVRESDVETFQLSSMKTEASSHVRDPTSDPILGLASTSTADTRIVPSYAMGNDLLMDGLSTQELETRVTSQQLLYAVLHLMQTKLNDSAHSAKGKRKRSIRSEEEEEEEEDEDRRANMEASVHRVVQCRACPLFHAPPRRPSSPNSSPNSLCSTSSAPPFTISCAADALACLHVFQAVSQTPLPVLAASFMDLVHVVFNIPGLQRRPPSAHDLNIYSTHPEALLTSSSSNSSSLSSDLSVPPDSTPCAGVAAVTATLQTDTEVLLSSINVLSGMSSETQHRILHLVQQPTFHLHTIPQKHDIPHVPGAFLLTDVLSPLECCQLMTMAETMHYTPDAVFGIDNVIWLGNDSLMSLLASRVEPLMPAELNNRQFAGINARLRLFRYYAGAVYRPHIDGAWPGSGLTADGTFTDDAFSGDRHSQLTFLVYLNDGFSGGATTFFLPGKQNGDEDSTVEGGEGGQARGVIEARGVKPRQGSVLCFPHGNAIGSLVHEGSAVANGVKYVIRSDALYYVEEKSRH